MHSLIRRAEKRFVRIYEFWQNLNYYIFKGYRLRKAWEMAGVTLP